MKRFTSLFMCLAFLGAATATVPTVDARAQLEGPGCRSCGAQDDGAKDGAAKDGAVKEKAPAGRGFDSGAICLQYLLYDDGIIAMWIVDHYSEDLCTDIPVQEYLFTEPGLFAPQVCGGTDGYPKCSEPARLIGAPGVADVSTPATPILKTPLGPDETDSYLDWLEDKEVNYPDDSSVSSGTANTNTVWHPKTGLQFGEFDTEYVKVRKKGGGANDWVVLKLSDGVARFGKVDFAGDAKPRPEKLKYATRDFSIGFESEKPADQVSIKLTPKNWGEPYKASDTAFVVTYDGVLYHVLTKTPVAVPH